jgi:hypothetical protein
VKRIGADVLNTAVLWGYGQINEVGNALLAIPPAALLISYPFICLGKN